MITEFTDFTDEAISQKVQLRSCPKKGGVDADQGEERRNRTESG